ncbi:MAG: hypothetical protein PHY93_14270 [Bacteriovorax sp.]|nr:hypothetical protein [Bacteriovorax sp.]
MKFTAFIFLSLLLTNSFAATTTAKKKTKTKKATQSKEVVQAISSQASSTTSVPNAYLNEIFTNITKGSLNIGKGCKDCESRTTIDVHASYLRYLQDKIQAGLEGGLNSTSGGNSTTLIDLAAVGVYNLDNNLSNSFFGKVGLGIFTVPTIGSDTETKLGAFVGAGKRFSWLTNVNYVPEFRIVKKGNIDIGLELTLLNFSIHWN